MRREPLFKERLTKGNEEAFLDRDGMVTKLEFSVPRSYPCLDRRGPKPAEV
jgi:hypothetical protein